MMSGPYTVKPSIPSSAQFNAYFISFPTGQAIRARIQGSYRGQRGSRGHIGGSVDLGVI